MINIYIYSIYLWNVDLLIIQLYVLFLQVIDMSNLTSISFTWYYFQQIQIRLIWLFLFIFNNKKYWLKTNMKYYLISIDQSINRSNERFNVYRFCCFCFDYLIWHIFQRINTCIVLYIHTMNIYRWYFFYKIDFLFNNISLLIYFCKI